MTDRKFASLFGFRYYIRPQPRSGANVAKENFSLGLLRHGSFTEYWAFHDDDFLRSLREKEALRAYFRNEKLHIARFKAILEQSKTEFEILHFEDFDPFQEISFRGLFKKKNIPATRRLYTISTPGHLRQFLTLCLLSCGGRPYDSIVVPSSACKEALQGYFADLSSMHGASAAYKGRVDAIGHGIDIDRFTPPDDKRELRAKLDLPLDSKIVLSLGRLSSVCKMSYGRILKMFVELIRLADEEVFLVLAGAGQGSDVKEIDLLCKELGVSSHVRVVRDFEEADKPLILGASDVFICMSDNLQESFGIALVEAMAMGLPVVCTDWSGFKDVVEDSVTGYRIPVKWNDSSHAEAVHRMFDHPFSHSVFAEVSEELEIDNHLFARRVKELLFDKNCALQMGEAGRARALQEFSLKAEISQFEDLWEELGAQAKRDTREYRDFGPVLQYDYLRHFQGYSSSSKDRE